MFFDSPYFILQVLIIPSHLPASRGPRNLSSPIPNETDQFQHNVANPRI